jgi:hypothetical protein
MSHFRNKRLRAANPEVEFDLSREKGLGLIILLHGVPGVGKLTASRRYLPLHTLFASLTHPL